MTHTAVTAALAEVVAREADARGLSVRSLASATGIPNPTLARRLNHTANSPFTAGEIERIAAVFGVRPSDLFLSAEASAA